MRDVAIVGAGPVGLFLAAALARRGVDTVLLERREGERQHSRAIGIHPPALAALDRLGVGERVIAEGVRVDRGVLRIGGREAAALEFGALPGTFPFVLTLPQVATERILRAELAARAPDALQSGSMVRRVERHPGFVRLVGPGAPVDARLVIGADGAQSVVRRAAGLAGSLHDNDYPHRYVMGDFADGTADGPVAVLHLHPEGIVESFPLPGGVRRWVTHLPAEERGVADPGEADPVTARLLARLVRERTGLRLDPASATMTSRFGVRRRAVQRMASGRMLVVGDAAHEVSPIGGQGMNLGWLDAEQLADLVPGMLRTGRADPLGSWQRTRLRSAARAARMAEFNMAMGEPCGRVGFVLRRAVVSAASGPLLRRRLAEAFTMHGL